MDLNQDQQKALEMITEFLLDPAQKEMALTGGPGVGKSYMTRYVVDNLEDIIKGGNTRISDIVLTATTNQAATVLSLATNRFVSTIHSFLKLTLKKDFKSGKLKLAKGRNYGIVYDSLVIIDEASMIDSHLLQIIRSSFCNCKILFIGDRNQLPPVEEAHSPVFNQDLPLAVLKEIMRFQGDLQTLSTALGNAVEAQVYVPIIGNKTDIIYIDDDRAQELIFEKFSKENYSLNSAKILAYTNAQTLLYSRFVREEVLGLPSEFVVGEFVDLNSPVTSLGSNDLLKTDTPYEITEIKGESQIGPLKVIEIELDNAFYTLMPADHDDYLQALALQKRLKNWEMYYAIKERVADLRPTYASTVHKSQGSTYDEVFVDLSDIGTCRQPEVLRRLLNVACSRARKTLYLIGDLPDKYKG